MRVKMILHSLLITKFITNRITSHLNEETGIILRIFSLMSKLNIFLKIHVE